MDYLISDAIGWIMVALAVLGVFAAIAVAWASTRVVAKDMRHAWRNLCK